MKPLVAATVASLTAVSTLYGIWRLLLATEYDGWFPTGTQKRTTETRIVGGQPANVGEYPTFVFTAGPQLCGATLIWYDIVLTAAHCEGAFLDGVLIDGVRVDGSDGRYIGVDVELPHPEYSFETDANDIMVVKLSEIILDVPLQALNFDPDLPQDGEEVTVIGLGYEVENGRFSDVLNEVNVNIVNFDECNELYGRLDRDIMLCAGSGTEGRDSCQGDSGGPLLTDRQFQVGIVSFGQGCARPNIPAVYVRVSNYEQFINDQICALSDNAPGFCDASTTNPTPPILPTTSPTTTASTLVPTVLNTASPTNATTLSPTKTPTPPPTNATTLSPTNVPSVPPTQSPSATPSETSGGRFTFPPAQSSPPPIRPPVVTPSMRPPIAPTTAAPNFTPTTTAPPTTTDTKAPSPWQPRPVFEASQNRGVIFRRQNPRKKRFQHNDYTTGIFRRRKSNPQQRRGAEKEGARKGTKKAKGVMMHTS